MPYDSNRDLPVAIRQLLPIDALEVYRIAANVALAKGCDENDAIRAGWAKVYEGWRRPDSGKGKWVKKAKLRKDGPTLSDVHVPSTDSLRKKPKRNGATMKLREDEPILSDVSSKTTKYSVGDRVKVKPGKDHDGMGKGETGTIEEISTPALGIKFPSMPEIHKWYADDEVELVTGETKTMKGEHGGINIFITTAPPAEPVTKTVTYDEQRARIVKIDKSRRIVYGWANVITESGVPVEDLQGDVIRPGELVKFTTEFMIDTRVGKTNHAGDQTHMVVHSFPLTYELAKALGIETQDEGWLVGVYVHDTDTLAKVESGELPAFSIGGGGDRVPLFA